MKIPPIVVWCPECGAGVDIEIDASLKGLNDDGDLVVELTPTFEHRCPEASTTI